MRPAIPRVLLFWMVLYAARAAVAWFGYGAILQPDTALYVSADPWFYPSPLGRLVGLGGVGALAALNIAGAGVLAFGIWHLARRWGGDPNLALGVFALCPASFYTHQAGVDTMAAALLVCAVASRRDTFGWAAAFLHPATVGGWALWRVARGSLPAVLTFVVLGLCVSVAVLLSDYGGVFAQIGASSILFSVVTAIAGGVVFIAFRWAGIVSLNWGGRVGGVAYLVGALQAGMQGHLQVRYLLPGTALVCASLVVRSK